MRRFLLSQSKLFYNLILYILYEKLLSFYIFTSLYKANCEIFFRNKIICNYIQTSKNKSFNITIICSFARFWKAIIILVSNFLSLVIFLKLLLYTFHYVCFTIRYLDYVAADTVFTLCNSKFCRICNISSFIFFTHYHFF